MANAATLAARQLAAEIKSMQKKRARTKIIGTFALRLSWRALCRVLHIQFCMFLILEIGKFTAIANHPALYRSITPFSQPFLRPLTEYP